ncbi:G patch domain-containing protein 1-like [Saccoglossus kowalevskii]|uniref:G patch domain-containing protein 1-like n=1 Tax=Saccoglossus kowalevskii TaxID=10224 RepID=A0ABM0MRF3_SACKO|nr:PREDICTED: G patch domain-containing protein 1-like [Saccoglossus kowalevskii]
MDADSDGDTFVTYGTLLKQLEDDAPRKKPISIEDQTVHDEKGRRRFHGAFSGGFSAGYFNTVGSKEGWTPSTFVSSRNKRADQNVQRPEDYMDTEDLGEFGIAPKKITTTDDFASDEKDNRKRTIDSSSIIPGLSALDELVIPTRTPIGIRLLSKMGWKKGQGIGPKIKRKTKKKNESKTYGCAPPPDSSSADEDEDEYAVGHYFAPKDAETFLFKPKDDVHGIGYQGINPNTALLGTRESEEHFTLFEPKATHHVGKKGISGKAFGIGAFEDDDDDIYAQDHMSNYDRVLDGKDPTKSFGWTAPRHNRKGNIAVQTTHVSRVLEGFTLSDKQKPPNKIFSAVPLAADFKPFHRFNKIEQPARQVDKLGGRFSLSANQRASILGEEQLPGPSSIFDIISKEDKDKLKSNTSAVTSSVSMPTSVSTSRFSSSSTPLFTGNVSDFKPFVNDPEKQRRYEEYLHSRKSGIKDNDNSSGTMTEWEKELEKEEFARSAALYQPLRGMMASRFTSAKYSDDTDTVDVPKEAEGDKNEQVKAAEMKMFGKLTRDVLEWHPDRLLSKRFNIPDPYPGSSIIGLPTVKKDKFSVFNFLSSGWDTPSTSANQENSSQPLLALRAPPSTSTTVNLFSSIPVSIVTSQSPSVAESGVSSINSTEIKTIQNADSLERPPMDLFKAIFENTDSEEKSSENEDDEEEKASSSNPELQIEGRSMKTLLPGSQLNVTDQQLSNIFGSNALLENCDDKNKDSINKQSKDLSSETVDDNLNMNTQKTFGPALPPAYHKHSELTQGYFSYTNPDKNIERNSVKLRKDSVKVLQRRHKHKDKHKKAKKKKKHKHKHKSKHKSSQREPDTDTSSSDDDNEGRIDNTELLQRLKSLPNKRHRKASKLM